MLPRVSACRLPFFGTTFEEIGFTSASSFMLVCLVRLVLVGVFCKEVGCLAEIAGADLIASNGGQGRRTSGPTTSKAPLSILHRNL